MKRARLIALLLGLVTVGYAVLLAMTDGVASWPVWSPFLAAGALVIAFSFLRPRTAMKRYMIVVVLVVYTAIHAGMLIASYRPASAAPMRLASCLFLLAGLTLSAWSFRQAKRRKLSPRQAYFRN
jgi:hypothetical protein